MSSPGKFEVFLLHPSLLENLMCSRNLFKKVTPGKKERWHINNKNMNDSGVTHARAYYNRFFVVIGLNFV